MSGYYSDRYLKEQLGALLHDAPSARHRVLDSWGFYKRLCPELYVLMLDIEHWGQLPEPIQFPVRNHLTLFGATEVAARGGVTFDVTDGFSALFRDADDVVRTALALHQRREQFQTNVFRPLIRHHMEALHPDEPYFPNAHATFGFRILVFSLSRRRIQKYWDLADTQSSSERIFADIGTVIKRYANREGFVITQDVRSKVEYGEVFFPSLVPFQTAPNKNDAGGGTQELLDEVGIKQLYTHRPDALAQPPRCVLQEFSTATSCAALEEAWRGQWKVARDWYEAALDQWSKFQDVGRCGAFAIETKPVHATKMKVAVFGDINVDHVCYVDESLFAQGGEPAQAEQRMIRHVQDRGVVQRSAGGKALGMAETLSRAAKFDPILLVGKMGIDDDMRFVLESLRRTPRVEPFLSFSKHAATGSSISIRLRRGEEAILTVTNDHNANTRLTMEEIEGHLEDLLSSDYLYVSGYCLLDERRGIIKRIADRLTAKHERKLILELSPWRQIGQQFRNFPEEMQRLLKASFLVVYEYGLLDEETEKSDLLPHVEHALQLKFKSGQQRSLTRSGQWDSWSTFQEGGVSSNSMGLVNRLTVEHIDRTFLRPRIILCSKSPRRFSLLAAVYGRRTVFYHHEAKSAEFEQDTVVANKGDLIHELNKVALTKLRDSIATLMGNVPGQAVPQQFSHAKAALSCDLVVVVPQDDGSWRILDKPDNDRQPVETARRYLSDYLNGRSHEVWTCAAFIGIDVDSHGESLGRALSAALDDEDFVRRNTSSLENVSVQVKSFGSLKIVLLQVRTEVKFRGLSEREMQDYLGSSEWRNKGGGYAIQGCGGFLVGDVQGSFTNVMGLPIVEVGNVLEEHFGIQASA